MCPSAEPALCTLDVGPATSHRVHVEPCGEPVGEEDGRILDSGGLRDTAVGRSGEKVSACLTRTDSPGETCTSAVRKLASDSTIVILAGIDG